MNESELFLIDAEYWITREWDLHLIVRDWCARLGYVERKYGINRDSEGYWIDWAGEAFTTQKAEHACFFALLIAAASAP